MQYDCELVSLGHSCRITLKRGGEPLGVVVRAGETIPVSAVDSLETPQLQALVRRRRLRIQNIREAAKSADVKSRSARRPS